MKKAKKIILIVFALLFFGFVIWYFTFFDVTYFGNMAIRKYHEVYGTIAEADNPEIKKQELLAELGDYDEYKLALRKRTIAVFTSYGLSLVGDYNVEEYQKQKEYILSHYSFANGKDQNVFKYKLDEKCAYDFDINNWHFYLLNEGQNNTEDYYIPEEFRMVAFNDADCKIAFLTFGDSDRDCFGENNDEKDLQEFVCESFRYNFKK